MAIRYSGTTIGTFTLCKKVREKVNGEYVDKLDDKGRPVYNKYPIQMRYANCMACFLYIHKIVNLEEPKKCWMHDLVMFFMDEKHLKNCLKEHTLSEMFYGEIRNVKLNLYYKDCQTMLKYFVQDGLKVECYYEKPSKQPYF